MKTKAPSDTISFITDLAAVNAVNVGEYAFTVSLDNEPNYNLLNDGEEIEFEIIPFYDYFPQLGMVLLQIRVQTPFRAILTIRKSMWGK